MPKILIVDDSSFQRRTIRRALAQPDYQIIEASNGRQAMQLVTEEAPDCILTDLIMPDMDGLMALKAWRDAGLTIPVIVVTADIQESTRQECIQLGAWAFINKPVKEDEVRKAVERALKRERGPDA